MLLKFTWAVIENLILLSLFLQSFLDFSEADIESWMKAANIDVYWECFKNGGITTGRQLQELDENSLRVNLKCNKNWG